MVTNMINLRLCESMVGPLEKKPREGLAAVMELKEKNSRRNSARARETIQTELLLWWKEIS